MRQILSSSFFFEEGDPLPVPFPLVIFSRMVTLEDDEDEKEEGDTGRAEEDRTVPSPIFNLY